MNVLMNEFRRILLWQNILRKKAALHQPAGHIWQEVPELVELPAEHGVHDVAAAPEYFPSIVVESVDRMNITFHSMHIVFVSKREELSKKLI